MVAGSGTVDSPPGSQTAPSGVLPELSRHLNESSLPGPSQSWPRKAKKILLSFPVRLPAISNLNVADSPAKMRLAPVLPPAFRKDPPR